MHDGRHLTDSWTHSLTSCSSTQHNSTQGTQGAEAETTKERMGNRSSSSSGTGARDSAASTGAGSSASAYPAEHYRQASLRGAPGRLSSSTGEVCVLSEGEGACWPVLVWVWVWVWVTPPIDGHADAPIHLTPQQGRSGTGSRGSRAGSSYSSSGSGSAHHHGHAHGGRSPDQTVCPQCQRVLLIPPNAPLFRCPCGVLFRTESLRGGGRQSGRGGPGGALFMGMGAGGSSLSSLMLGAVGADLGGRSGNNGGGGGGTPPGRAVLCRRCRRLSVVPATHDPGEVTICRCGALALPLNDMVMSLLAEGGACGRACFALLWVGWGGLIGAACLHWDGWVDGWMDGGGGVCVT